MAEPVTALTDRARAIFRAVVDGYLANGAPVGSKTLALSGINLSPASIRGVMASWRRWGCSRAPTLRRDACRPTGACACSSTA